MAVPAIHIGITDLFWLFIVLSSLQPMLKQRLLEASRRRLIGEIERKRGSRVILLAHRQETMSFLGIPIVRYMRCDAGLPLDCAGRQRTPFPSGGTALAARVEQKFAVATHCGT